jgi:histidinol phosphatase-like PHP family hydrolase
MTWQPLDCHAHTTFSDGALTVSQLVERARSRGVRPSVADHMSLDVSKSVKTIAGVREYLDALERHDVMRGGEFCWHDSLWRELPADLVRRFTHRVGSIHAIVLPSGAIAHAFRRRLPEELDADAYMRAHVDNLERFAHEMPVDILAHPTLLPRPFLHIPVEELWTEEREERAVKALLEAGIAFEISNRYRPHERFVRRAFAAGVRFALGSDGHTEEQVADVAFPLAFARRIGARDADLYDPSVHGSRTGYFEEHVRA